MTITKFLSMTSPVKRLQVRVSTITVYGHHQNEATAQWSATPRGSSLFCEMFEEEALQSCRKEICPSTFLWCVDDVVE